MAFSFDYSDKLNESLNHEIECIVVSNRSLISDTEGGITSAQESHNDNTDNQSQTGSNLSEDSSDVDDEGEDEEQTDGKNKK